MLHGRKWEYDSMKDGVILVDSVKYQAWKNQRIARAAIRKGVLLLDYRGLSINDSKMSKAYPGE